MSAKGWGIAIYTLVGTMLLAAFGFIAWRCDVKSSDIAAWVQAVGSIAAIFGAYSLARRQERIEEARRAADRQEAARQLTDAILMIARDATAAVQEATAYIRKHEKGQKFDCPSDRLENAQFALRGLLERTMPVELVAHLLVLQRQVTYTMRAIEQCEGTTRGMADASIESADKRDTEALRCIFRIAEFGRIQSQG